MQRVVVVGLCMLLGLQLAAGSGRTMDERIDAASGTPGTHVDGTQPDGTYVDELDMLLTEKQRAALFGGSDDDDDTDGDRKKRKAIEPADYYRWPGGVIPYVYVENTFSAADIAVIEEAMDEWMRVSCLTFRPRTASDPHYIYYQNGGGCSSYIGNIQRDGGQPVTLAPGCRYKDIILHELGHALGFYHEQTRTDRDNYVVVLWDNIRSSSVHNFRKASPTYHNDYGVPYDYGSIMHYGTHYFTENSLATLQTIDPAAAAIIGRGTELTAHDIKIANNMYNCINDAIACGDDSTVGPHTLACLQEFWHQAGCVGVGSGSPTASSVDLYDSLTVGEIRAAMEAVYNATVAGDAQAAEQCWGCKGDAEVGPHPSNCLGMYFDAYCPDSIVHPATNIRRVDVTRWSTMTVAEVKVDMATFLTRAQDPTSLICEKRLCFGFNF